MSNNKTKELSKEFWIVLIAICLFFIVLIGIGFFTFANREKDVIVEEEAAGKITLNYSSTTNGLTITKVTPTTDAVGMKSENYFEFSIKSKLEDDQEVEYEIAILKNNKKSTIPDDGIKIYLEKEKDGLYTDVFGPDKYEALKSNTEIGSKKGEMVIANVSRSESGTDNYRLRIWMSDKCILEQGDYSVDVNLYAKVK